MSENNYSLGLYEKSMPNSLNWKQKLEIAKKTGFDFVEISIDETDEKLARLDMTAQERVNLVAVMSEIGIHFETMCLSGHRKYSLGSLDDETRAHGLQIMGKAIILARDLGIRIIQLAGYDVYYENSTEQTRALFADNLQKSVQLAAKFGVLLAFETMETPFLNTVKKAMYWVKKSDSPYLMVYPDSGNLTNAAIAEGKDVLDDIEAGRGHLAAFHLKETVPGKFREIPYGMGHVNFEAIIQKSYELGVRRYTAEFWYVGQENWTQAIADSHVFLRERFVDAGL
jgi:L-ribulose-5-phosphate 3-epimerase